MEDDSVDIIQIARIVWSGRKLILKAALFSFALGCIVALVSPVIYEAQTTFVPQTSDQSSSTTKSGYAELATLAGINLNAAVGSSLDNYISPLLYTKIAESEEFSMSLVNENLFTLNGEKLTIKDYLLIESDKINIVGLLKKYTVGLLKSEKKEEGISEQFSKDYNFISNDDYNLIKSFKEKFLIELDEKQGFIKVKANDKSAFISAQIVRLVTQNLQSRIISLRTKKIKEQLDYSLEQYEKQRHTFEVLQNNLAEFKDSNKNISTAVFLSQLQRLESEYSLQQNILMRLANEYNSNKIKLNKDTPIFSVLDEVSVPTERSEPKRQIIAFSFMLAGIFITIVYLLSKESINEIIQKIKKN